MDSAREASGLSQKLSVSDLTGFLSGMEPINYIDNPDDKEQVFDLTNGLWGFTNWSATLDKGTYCFSTKILSSSGSIFSGRLEFVGMSSSNRFDIAYPVGEDSNPWGFAGQTYYNPGFSGLLVMTFIVVKSATFSFGISGNPFSGGQLKVKCPMINKGLLPLPFTKNTHGGGGN